MTAQDKCGRFRDSLDENAHLILFGVGEVREWVVVK